MSGTKRRVVSHEATFLAFFYGLGRRHEVGVKEQLREGRQQAYLKYLAETGSVMRACQAVKINKSLPWRWRQRYPHFSTEEEAAVQAYRKTLEDRLVGLEKN